MGVVKFVRRLLKTDVPKEMSLENLTMFDFSDEAWHAFQARIAARDHEYKDKYGDKWKEKLDEDRQKEQESSHRKYINESIYGLGRLWQDAHYKPTQRELDEFDARLHEVYGDQYDTLVQSRIDLDPRVAELLIQDALRTGRGDELPDMLQDEYNRRKGNAL